MSAEEMKALTHRFIEEVWNKGKLALVDELLATDCVYHHPGGDLHGPDARKQEISVYRRAFPDLHVTIDDFVIEGNKAVTRWTLTGTHTSEFRGIPPTNKQITMWGIIINRVTGGKFVEEWETYDRLEVMRQLGVIPPRGSLVS